MADQTGGKVASSDLAVSSAKRAVSILLVEDAPSDLTTLDALLRRELAPCTIALEHIRSLPDALVRLGQGNVDLVLLALNLPGYSGMEALSALLAEYPDISVLPLPGAAAIPPGSTPLRRAPVLA